MTIDNVHCDVHVEVSHSAMRNVFLVRVLGRVCCLGNYFGRIGEPEDGTLQFIVASYS